MLRPNYIPCLSPAEVFSYFRSDCCFLTRSVIYVVCFGWCGGGLLFGVLDPSFVFAFPYKPLVYLHSYPLFLALSIIIYWTLNSRRFPFFLIFCPFCFYSTPLPPPARRLFVLSDPSDSYRCLVLAAFTSFVFQLLFLRRPCGSGVCPPLVRGVDSLTPQRHGVFSPPPTCWSASPPQLSPNFFYNGAF